MADPSIINEWLTKADEDFGFAVSVLEDSTFYAQICFHFHQSAEKYLKSFIIARDLESKEFSKHLTITNCPNRFLKRSRKVLK
jgi:HEPN domain-containing protein